MLMCYLKTQLYFIPCCRINKRYICAEMSSPGQLRLLHVTETDGSKAVNWYVSLSWWTKLADNKRQNEDQCITSSCWMYCDMYGLLMSGTREPACYDHLKQETNEDNCCHSNTFDDPNTKAIQQDVIVRHLAFSLRCIYSGKN